METLHIEVKTKYINFPSLKKKLVYELFINYSNKVDMDRYNSKISKIELILEKEK